MNDDSERLAREKRENRKLDKPKRSVLISSDLHYELKQAALRHDMFIHEIIRESFKKWKEDKESYM